MPPLNNPDLIGEFDKFYYLIGEVPEGTDAELLAGTTTPPITWLPLCISNLDTSIAFEEHTFNDRCAPNFETVAPGRKAWSLSFELNQLRMTDGEVIVFEAAVDDREMFGFMALTSDPADTKTFGFVGNVVIIQSDENQPDAGPNVESYTMRPTVRRPAMLPRRIYGSGIPAATP